MRFFLFLLVSAAFLLQAQAVQAKYASIVIEANSGRILHQVNANTRNYPASLTKMMTLLMVFQALDEGRIKKGDRIIFSKYAAGRPPSKLGIHAGGFITVEQAIGALVTKSANDVATAVAEFLAGSESKFARRMTLRANALGMTRTQFRNASGLPNKGQLSTAKDMATLVQALQRYYPHYYHYFSMKRFHFRGKTYGNHNKLLGSFKGTDGVKTGYIRASGFNLAASVERGGVRLIGVVFGGKTSASRNAHMKTLLTNGFAKAKRPARTFAKAPIPPKLEPLQVQEPEEIAEEIVAVAPKQEVIQPSVAEDFSHYKVTTGNIAPPLPTAYKQGGLSYTIITQTPKKIALVQDFKTGNANYDGGGWSVQVGAYNELVGAENFFVKILPLIENSTNSKFESVILSQVQRRQGSIFKPRLVGLGKNDAYGLCKSLKDKKIDCLVISPNAG